MVAQACEDGKLLGVSRKTVLQALHFFRAGLVGDEVSGNHASVRRFSQSFLERFFNVFRTYGFGQMKVGQMEYFDLPSLRYIRQTDGSAGDLNSTRTSSRLPRRQVERVRLGIWQTMPDDRFCSFLETVFSTARFGNPGLRSFCRFTFQNSSKVHSIPP